MTRHETNMLFCDNCGEPCGDGKRERGDFISCGLPACIRAERNAYRQEEEEAQFAAEQDGYSLYGGRGR